MNDAKGAEQKVFSLLGIAAKAGKIVSGEFSTESAVKSQKAYLTIIATDASHNTTKLFTDKCTYYKIPCVAFGTMDELGHAVGKKFRASLAVTDEGLARAIQKKIDELAISLNNGGVN